MVQSASILVLLMFGTERPPPPLLIAENCTRVQMLRPIRSVQPIDLQTPGSSIPLFSIIKTGVMWPVGRSMPAVVQHRTRSTVWTASVPWWELTTGSRMLCEELSVITSLMVHINALARQTKKECAKASLPSLTIGCLKPCFSTVRRLTRKAIIASTTATAQNGCREWV